MARTQTRYTYDHPLIRKTSNEASQVSQQMERKITKMQAALEQLASKCKGPQIDSARTALSNALPLMKREARSLHRTAEETMKASKRMQAGTQQSKTEIDGVTKQQHR